MVEPIKFSRCLLIPILYITIFPIEVNGNENRKMTRDVLERILAHARRQMAFLNVEKVNHVSPVLIDLYGSHWNNDR